MNETSFNPPYHLQSKTSISWLMGSHHQLTELFRKNHASDDRLKLKILNLFGFTPCVLIASAWEPQKDHPVPYNEVILATFARIGFTIYSLPITLYLDDPFHVELGIKHYHLPKKLDSSMTIDITSKNFHTKSKNFDIQLSKINIILHLLTYPLMLIMGFFVKLYTERVSILGTLFTPWIQSIISVVPSIFTGSFGKCNKIQIEKINLFCIFSLVWQKSNTVVNAPKKI